MDPGDERESIRQKKREQLIERIEGTAKTETGSEGTAESKNTPTHPVHVKQPEEFDDLVGRHRVVLVDFHAEWCGPCKQLDPIVTELASELPVTVAKVDIDVHQSLARRHNVRGVPTLVLYTEGEPVEHLVGMQSRATLHELCNQYL